MKKYMYATLVIFTLGCMESASSQSFTIGPNGMTLKPNTIFFVDNVTLHPSENFTLSNNSFVNTSTVANSINKPHIKRVHRFSSVTTPFNGRIQVNLPEEAELIGIEKSDLSLNLHDGQVWNALIGTLDQVNNSLSTNINGSSLSEFTLAKSSEPKPLSFLDFTATKQANNVLLQWTTQPWLFIKSFKVQYSIDGIFWNNLTTINTILGSNNNTYNYTHTAPSTGINYYRILIDDYYARSLLSPVRTVKFANDSETFYVFGNPVTGGILQVQVEQGMTLTLYNAEGKLLQQIKAAIGLQSIDVSSYPKGLYLLRGNHTVVKVIIN